MNCSDRCSIGMEEGNPSPILAKLAKRRTVETNKMKRLMYNRSVRGQSEPDTCENLRREGL